MENAYYFAHNLQHLLELKGLVGSSGGKKKKGGKGKKGKKKKWSTLELKTHFSVDSFLTHPSTFFYRCSPPPPHLPTSVFSPASQKHPKKRDKV